MPQAAAISINLEHFASMIAAKIVSLQTREPVGKLTQIAKVRGLKRHMQCRAPRCKQRSRGPRFGYFCLNHDHLHKPRAKAAA